MASTNAETNSVRNTARAARSSVMLASSPPPRGAPSATWPLAHDLVAKPIANARADQQVEREHAPPQHGKLVAGNRGLLRLLRTARGQRAFDQVGEGAIDHGRDHRPDDGAEQAAVGKIDHAAPPSFRRQSR